MVQNCGRITYICSCRFECVVRAGLKRGRERLKIRARGRVLQASRVRVGCCLRRLRTGGGEEDPPPAPLRRRNPVTMSSSSSSTRTLAARATTTTRRRVFLSPIGSGHVLGVQRETESRGFCLHSRESRSWESHWWSSSVVDGV